MAFCTCAGPPLHLPGEVQCMEVWQVLQGLVQQRRVWTFGMQTPAALPAPPPPAAADTAAEEDPAGLARQFSSPHLQPPPSAQLPDVQGLVEPCISSREPQSIKDGVRFVSCAAGHHHSAAAAEGGYVFTWGSNDKGQLGCDTSTQQPVVVHVLSTAAEEVQGAGLSTSSNGGNVGTAAPTSAGSSTAASCSRAMLHKLDSLKQLGAALKLPSSLTAALQQLRQQERDEATEQHEQQQLLLQELLQHPELGQQQQLAGRSPALQPSAAQVTAHAAVLSGISSGVLQQRQQQQEGRPQALAVYEVHLGQPVRSVACGAHHTLAALATSGLVSPRSCLRWHSLRHATCSCPPQCNQARLPRGSSCMQVFTVCAVCAMYCRSASRLPCRFLLPADGMGLQ